MSRQKILIAIILSVLVTTLIGTDILYSEEVEILLDNRVELSPSTIPLNLDQEADDRNLRRDDPADDWIIYDDGDPAYYLLVQSCWNRVRFTPRAEFTLWGANISAYNPNGIDDPMTVYVYSEDEGDLDELLWETETDEVANVEWMWFEIEEDDRPVFEAGETFSIIFGPAPGGNVAEGGGWSALFDNGSEVNNTYYVSSDEPPDDIDSWTNYGNDMMLRANGEYSGDFTDLTMLGVYDAAEIEDRRWAVWEEDSVNFVAEIVNSGSTAEDVSVVFRMTDSRNSEVFEETVEIDEIAEGDTIAIDCPIDWVVDSPYGSYELWVEIIVENDLNELDNKLGLDQIVMHPDNSSNTWLGYTDGGEGGNWYFGGDGGFNEEAGWAAVYYHPGGYFPIWLTDLRAMTYKDADEEIELTFEVYVMDTEDNTLTFEWSGMGYPAFNNPSWVELELDEEDYVQIVGGQALVVLWKQAANTYLRRSGVPPQAAANRDMPFAMLQTQDAGENWSISTTFDAAIQVKVGGPDDWSGVVMGNVSKLDGGDPIEGALVSTSLGFETLTDANGDYSLRNWTGGRFDLTVSHLGYNDSTLTNIQLDKEDTLVADFALKSPGIELSHEELSVTIPPDSSYETVVTIYNVGDGILDWRISREWTGETEAAPWEELAELEAGQITQDSRLAGVAYIDGYFYVSGSEPDTNTVYVFNEDGDLERTFPQVGSSNNGMPDLAYDGQYLWGSGERDIYQFDTEGNQIAVLEGPINPTKGVAWDSNNEWLWVCGSRSDIFAIDMDGEIAAEIERPDVILGSLFFCPDDPDGYMLYAIAEDPNDDLFYVYRFDTQTGDNKQDIEIAAEDFKGLFATNQYDPYSWVLMSLEDQRAEDGGDIVNVTQLHPNVSWLQADVTSGSILPTGDADINFNFSAVGLPRDQFPANIIFNHNADNSPTTLPVEFNVFGGPRPPSVFDLVSPANGDTIGVTDVEFSWRRSFDPNPDDEVSYVFTIKAEESQFIEITNEISLQLELAETELVYEPGTVFDWWVTATSNGDTVECNNRFEFTYLPSDVPGETLPVPTEFDITGVFPNPFNASFEIRYSLNRAVSPQINVYDFNGRLVESIRSNPKKAGYYIASIDASTWPSGIYMAQVIAGSEVRSAKVIAIK